MSRAAPFRHVPSSVPFNVDVVEGRVGHRAGRLDVEPQHHAAAVELHRPRRAAARMQLSNALLDAQDALDLRLGERVRLVAPRSRRPRFVGLAALAVAFPRPRGPSPRRLAGALLRAPPPRGPSPPPPRARPSRRGRGAGLRLAPRPRSRLARVLRLAARALPPRSRARSFASPRARLRVAREPVPLGPVGAGLRGALAASSSLLALRAPRGRGVVLGRLAFALRRASPLAATGAGCDRRRGCGMGGVIGGAGSTGGGCAARAAGAGGADRSRGGASPRVAEERRTRGSRRAARRRPRR